MHPAHDHITILLSFVCSEKKTVCSVKNKVVLIIGYLGYLFVKLEEEKKDETVDPRRRSSSKKILVYFADFLLTIRVQDTPIVFVNFDVLQEDVLPILISDN